MTYARDQGYPVPAVDELRNDDTELVMERLDGQSMMERLIHKPWTMAHHGAVLAELHQRLHDIGAPPWLPPSPTSKGDRLLHFDLHPMNVMLTKSGPMVIDWTGARRGNPPTDAALTWVLIASGGIPARRATAFFLGQGRRPLIGSFLKHFDDRHAIVNELPAVVEWKVGDPHMSPGEQAAMWRLVTTARAR
jgi:Ser/Thr protein kinase RdoA (MazF antagonist)